LQQLYGVILSKAEQMAGKQKRSHPPPISSFDVCVFLARLEEDEALYQRVCRGN
jgi:hypothetical protein